MGGEEIDMDGWDELAPAKMPVMQRDMKTPNETGLNAKRDRFGRQMRPVRTPNETGIDVK